MNSDAPLRLAIFDCDGTLVDSAHSIIEAMSVAWTAEGLGARPTDHAIRSIVGLHLLEAIGRLLPEGDDTVHQRLADQYKAAFFDIRHRPDHDEPLYPGAVEEIEKLEAAGVLLAVATGKSRRGLEVTLGRHDLIERFVCLKTADDGPGKPHPAILLDAMREVGVEPRNTVMIGDTTFDITMAVNAAVTPIGVDWGYHEGQALSDAGAEIVLDTFQDLEPALKNIWRL